MGKVLKILIKTFLKDGFLPRKLPQNHCEASLRSFFKMRRPLSLPLGPWTPGQSRGRCVLSAHFPCPPCHYLKAGCLSLLESWPIPPVDALGLGWDPRFYTSDELPGDARWCPCCWYREGPNGIAPES